MDYASFSRDALDCFCKPLWQDIDYLVHYRRNIKELRDQAQKLNAVVLDVNILVDQAASRGERIRNQVEDWVRRAKDKALEAQNLNNEIQANQNHRCFSTCCTPNWRSRYNLSKQAVSIAKEMGVIYGEKNFEGVSLPVLVSPPISKPTAPAPVGHFMLFESRTHARDDVLKALKHDKNNIVGIHGMGGVGKTTMVKQVAEKVISEGLFDRVVLATVSQTVNLRKIQDSIADDDIWESIDLSQVGIPFGCDLEACKSKILFTTRREHVCHTMGCKENSSIHLKILSPEDSWNLFVKTANRVLDSSEYEDVARQVVGKCQGLPLALETVAKALGDKDVEEWKKAVRRLQMSVPANPDHLYNKVAECIKLSYDFLKDPKVKAFFLICCLFPEDHNISKIVLARSINHISILGALKKLEILSLTYSRINTLPKELAELTELRLLDMTACDVQTIPPNIISRLHGLEELYLQGSFFEWGNRVKGTNEERNASLEELYIVPVHTRTLSIDTTMSTLPDWFVEAVTEKAEMIIYFRCRKLNNIVVEYGKGRLFGLKSLIVQLSSGECLIDLAYGIPNNPVFENLQELCIYDMESMKEICIGQLPPGSFEKLKFLDVQRCRFLENSLLNSNIIQRFYNLEKLHLYQNSIKEVFGFEGLHEGRRYLERLKEIRLDNLSELANIWKGPAQLADFKNLKTVIVIKCNKLKYLFSPSMSQGLLQLEELWVEDCLDLGCNYSER
uniref:NB-ARC domain-containing protein n=1 Tax=Fagus sylvatica TaxID=28930 RepID=A0A2N9ELW2_FAGSY